MKDQLGEVMALVGGQYGSEGKGVVSAHLAHEFDIHVRVGGPNAGHSFYYGDQVFKMQAVPCGWKNLESTLVIGRGGMIDLELLKRELEAVAVVDPHVYQRVLIDTHTGVLDPSHHAAEGGVEGELHQRIGSTGEGVGAARAARMARNPAGYQFAKDFGHFQLSPSCNLASCLRDNTPEFLNQSAQDGSRILLEGTQGSALSLIHGPWPFVTSADTNASQMAADVGMGPRRINKVVLVMRTFPIRVAGNSGPLNDELTWEQLSAELGVAVTERTTVTKKIRRVGRWDWDLAQRGVTLNNPTSVALMFIDYICPGDAGKTKMDDLSSESIDFINSVEDNLGVSVSMVGTGGDRWAVIDRVAEGEVEDY